MGKNIAPYSILPTFYSIHNSALAETWCTKTFCGGLWIITQTQKRIMCDFGPRYGAENISGIVGCFELFFDKEITQQIFREPDKYAEQYKKSQGSLFSFQ